MPSTSNVNAPSGSRPTRLLLLALVGLGVVFALGLRRQRTEAPPAVAEIASSGARLVELGSTTCASCKAMHEELAKLRLECGQSITVQEIDVWKDEEAARRYGVRVIPTQVFLDGEGRELGRHVGFLARNDIRERFAQRGTVCP